MTNKINYLLLGICLFLSDVNCYEHEAHKSFSLTGRLLLNYNSRPIAYYPEENIYQSGSPGKPYPPRQDQYVADPSSNIPVIYNKPTNQVFKPVLQDMFINLNDRNNAGSSFRPSRPYDETIPAKPPVPPSSFHPVPVHIPQLISSGKPWPARPEEYPNFSQTDSSVSLEDRLKEEENLQTTRRPISRPSGDTIPALPAVPPPSFHPRPIYTPQLVPSGQPWPASAQGYMNFSQTTLPPFVQRPQTSTVSLADRLGEESADTIPAKPPVAPPSFHPRPTYTPQLVPSGQPWPASAEGYVNFSQTTLRPFSQRPSTTTVSLADRLGEDQNSGDTIPAKPAVRPPSFHPVPIYTPQLIPPGKPWPANAEGYQNFSQSSSNFNQRPQSISLEDRIKEEQRPVSNTQQSGGTIPIRPTSIVSSYYPRPIYTPQLVPSGQQWPGSADGYKNFSQTTERSYIEEVVQIGDRSREAGAVRSTPTRAPSSTSTFPSLLHTTPKQDNSSKQVPVHRAHQIIFPDDEIIKFIITEIGHAPTNSGNREIPSTSSLPTLFHTSSLEITTHRHELTPNPQELNLGVLHTSPQHPVTDPPPGSLFTSKPSKDHKPLTEHERTTQKASRETTHHHSLNNEALKGKPNIAVANLLPDSHRVTDTGFNEENFVATNLDLGVPPPDNVLTSATIISHMQQDRIGFSLTDNRGVPILQHTGNIHQSHRAKVNY